ncbi:tRNA lysidine(34) synthetase TilS [Flavobacterium silvaticum]|uniref:tRNA(Ile)-lysidine synthase n=1 Tax=Flavobacterium silvaticum TaxID=1852020 RepID=A0A972FUI8_9FLAO|nr:tRNA lysidine(34) synthetase TilS [Flavobacterium silvaticum]NMH28763.1 tRNA lysidine(34) synthetase TilS [Flavobacterium silvaticum]
MQDRFGQHIQNGFSFLNGKKLLIACSGGLDSMVMSELFRRMGSDISLVHCNFGLRGLESDNDADFVKAYADSHSIPLYLQKFDTQKFASDTGLSIQLAARELRYNWFEEIRSQNNLDFILTAHHADDNLETFLINLSRGTGIEGLTGIPARNGYIVRPMLAFSREDIAAFAASEGIEWREDSSNASDKYLRNKIRHDIVPLLKQLQPSFLNSFADTQNYLQQTQTMAEDAAIMVYQRIATENGDEISFDLDTLLKLPNFASYLYQWLREYGFSAWDDIAELTAAISGKQVHSPTHTLLRDRNRLLLFPRRETADSKSYRIDTTDTIVNFPVKLEIKKVESISDVSNTVIFADASLLEFPLEIRRWQQGDTFCPLGMGGKSKKLSKFFKDEKIPLHKKEDVWLLLSEGKIVWVIGMRQDERFKIQTTTTTILRLTTE